MSKFCTLFDSNYLSRGLALYESLKKYCDDFLIYIFAFDDNCYNTLLSLKLENARIISLSDFEDEDLRKVKGIRSRAEYCWTCTPSTLLYVFSNYNEEVCTYLDSDIYFFSSPDVLLDELGESSVIITEHRYTEKYDSTETSGKYNVQFITVKNNKQGLEVLNWWRSACLDSCELNPQEGKCGDQKYLDDWMDRFECVHELQNLGGGVAPWNVQQYNIFTNKGEVYCKTKKNNVEFPLVFYHFHSLKFYLNGIVQLSGPYEITNDVIKNIYKNYILFLEIIRMQLENKGVNFNPHGAEQLYFKRINNLNFKSIVVLAALKKSIKRLSFDDFFRIITEEFRCNNNYLICNII